MLRSVAEVGYRGVELAGYGGLPASELKAHLDELGLVPAGSHVRLDRLEGALDEEIGYAEKIGCRDLICPVLPEARRGSLDDYRQLAEFLNAAGARCRDAGLRLSYHNHAFEYTEFPEQDAYAMDLLLGWTEPGVVYWEPDVYWIAKAGEDPAAYLRRYVDRCALVHLKDMANDAEGSFAEVGAGVLDFAQMFEAVDARPDWFVVEQDRTKGPPLESVRLSLENLRKWGKA
jgi:sugar phosphate isomerase/epimerase